MRDTLFFIPPGIDLEGTERMRFVSLSKDTLRARWQTPDGQIILDAWKTSDYDRGTLAKLVGSYDQHIDLRGINLQSTCLKGKDLSYIDFYAASFRGCDLSEAKLSYSYLSESDIRETTFDRATMEQVLLDGADFNEATSFSGVDLSRVNFTLATLVRDLALAQQDHLF